MIRDILIAIAAVGAPALLIFWLEYRSRPRDPRSSALRSANKDKGARR